MAQIAFVTLFLGLTLGTQPVELTVSGPVATIELVLDGTPVLRLHGPPWRSRIDLGSRLEPHELVARALDRQGQEIARATQWLNLTRPPAEVEVVLERGAGGRVTAVRIAWQSLTGAVPSGIGALLDGNPLILDRERRFPIPAYDPGTSHVLTITLQFPDGLSARKDVVFGGIYGEEVSTELTGILVRLRKGKNLPPVPQLQGWFLDAGRPLHVAAVEEGPAELLVVRDLTAIEVLRKLEDQRWSRMSAAEQMGNREFLRFQMTLEPEDEIRLVWPIPKSYAGSSGLPTDLFDVTRTYTAKDGGLFWLISRTVPRAGAATSPQRLADAVAVAGLRTLDSNRRRAVLLMLAREPADGSRLDPALVRHYLETIRVPFYVWTVLKPWSTPPPSMAAWGELEDASSLNKMREAFERVKEDLESQVLIWVDGRHLPQSITLSPAAAEVVELLGK